MKTQERQLLATMVTGADQLSGSIASATWHAMLADQRESAYEIMQTIALKQGIKRIRIFNKEGRVMFSTAPGDTGSVDKFAEACFMCHATDRPLVKVDMPSRAREFHDIDGKRTLGIVTPVYNEPACSNADCHAHPASHERPRCDRCVPGPLNSRRRDRREHGIARDPHLHRPLHPPRRILVIVFSRRYVHAPIHKLIEGTRAVSKMQLDRPVEINSSEELGELARSFDVMRLRLRDAIDQQNLFAQNLETKVDGAHRTAQGSASEAAAQRPTGLTRTALRKRGA